MRVDVALPSRGMRGVASAVRRFRFIPSTHMCHSVERAYHGNGTWGSRHAKGALQGAGGGFSVCMGP